MIRSSGDTVQTGGNLLQKFKNHISKIMKEEDEMKKEYLQIEMNDSEYRSFVLSCFPVFSSLSLPL
jgi:hypothetical protein